MKKLTAIILALIMMLGTISAFASSEVYPYSSEWKISATSVPNESMLITVTF
jgi:hypothetical protein